MISRFDDRLEYVFMSFCEYGAHRIACMAGGQIHTEHASLSTTCCKAYALQLSDKARRQGIAMVSLAFVDQPGEDKSLI